MRTKLTVACALTAFVVVAGGTAEATGLINTNGIAKGAITFNRLSPAVQKMVSAKAVPGLGRKWSARSLRRSGCLWLVRRPRATGREG